MSDDLVAIARRAKGSAVLPTVSFGVLNAETLILKLADRIEELEGQLKNVLDREAATFARYDAKLDAADAKLAKAEALMFAGFAEYERRLALSVEFTKGVIRHAGNSGDDYLAEQARTTLTELKGQDDE